MLWIAYRSQPWRRSVLQVNKLVLPMDVMRYNKLKMAHKVAQVLSDLESEYSGVIAPLMDDLRAWQEILGANFVVLMHRDNTLLESATKFRLVRANGNAAGRAFC
jgi:hypothetical protein